MTEAQKEPGTALLPFDRKAIATVEARAEEFRLAIAEAPKMERGLLVGQAMTELRKMITPPMLECIKAGEGQPLGFKTDLWHKGERYSDDVIRDVFIEATLRQAFLVNNEVNIIAGGCYLAKNYFERRVREWPGLSDLEVAFSVPEVTGQQALVSARARYHLNGSPHDFRREHVTVEGGKPFDNRIPIRVNSGMGSDAILGKARRKFYAALLERLTGEPMPEGDVDDAINVEHTASRQPNVGQSNLFPDESPEPPQPTGPDEAAQDDLRVEYSQTLDECQTKADVGRVAKQAGGDTRLTDDSRKMIMAACTERRKKV